LETVTRAGRRAGNIARSRLLAGFARLKRHGYFMTHTNHQPLTTSHPLSCYKKNLKIAVRNLTRNTVLADSADLADTSEKRRTGLLKHDHLDRGQGLWIVPCESVHSFFMKFAIDLVYLDRNKKVRKVRRRMVPWRLSACLTAHSILELPAGVAEATGTQAGDQLAIDEL
jgi:hypothetical protein